LLDPTLPLPDGARDRTLFVDLETTGLSGGAGTVAFLVGCGWFDMGAFQVRQFLLTSYASERALLDAVASCFDAASLLVTYNGKTFDVPVMETRWSFHRMRMPLESVRHFDMLHPARRLWRSRSSDLGARASLDAADSGGCRLGTLERVLCDVTRVGDVPGLEIPGRYFQFLRTGDARQLEPVLEHNRLDLISLAAVAAHAVQLVEEGTPRCRDAAEALALGRVYERAGCIDRALDAYRCAADDESAHVDVRAEAMYRLGVRFRRDRRFDDAAACWRRVLELQMPRRHQSYRGSSLRPDSAQASSRPRRGLSGDGGQGYAAQGSDLFGALRQYAVQALAIHHEHRERDYEGAKELALQLLDDPEDGGRVRVTPEATKHRLARLEKKIARKNDSHLFG
jgi:uncharacterized protein YprB with RNaseH-like and TPR domain